MRSSFARALAFVTWILGIALGTADCKPRGTPAAPAGSATPTEGEDLLAPRGVPCGALDCRQYDSLGEAFQAILLTRPRLLAVGEAHAQKGTTVPSSAKHFTDEVLPLLAGRASDLLVELMNPPAGCGETTDVVRQKQEVVTRSQAPTDQGEYVAMGERARALGVIPDLLRPTCADLEAVKGAGDDAVSASLAMIARLTTTQAERMLERAAKTPRDADKMVVTYGGAIHNDLAPPRERAAWSFAPALDAATGGRLVAVELFIPELIEDTDNWRQRAFYAHYDRAKMGSKTTVFRDGRTFVVIVAAGSK